MHAPQEVPSRFSSLYDPSTYSDDYAIMNGMAAAADEVLGNVTAALQVKRMWNTTLLVYTSDNGGPAGELSSGHSGNNFPLRGGKTNLFEGGVRVVAFVTGGFVPAAVRGETRMGYIHACDWYHTMIKLAGGQPADDQTEQGLPQSDSINMWPYLINNVTSSPRTEILLSSEPSPVDHGKLPPNHDWNGALIVGPYKLILGQQSYGFWQAPRYPNATTNHSAELPVECGASGCLFNIVDDPSEYHDLAQAMPAKRRELMDTFVERNRTLFQAPRMATDKKACEAYVTKNGGFLGPYFA